MLRWELSGSSTRCPLTHMLPFLTVKREQAKLVLAMLSREWPESANKRGIRWTPEVSVEWEQAKRRLSKLNQTGHAAPEGAIAQRVGDQWMIPERDLFGERWVMFSGTFPASGSMRNGVVFRRPEWEPATSAGESSSWPGLLKTPTAQLAINGGSQHPDKRKAGGHGPTLADQVEHMLPMPAGEVVEMLLPTPVAHDDGKSPEAHMAMKARMPGGPRHSITSLAVAAQTLLPIGGLPQPGGTREPSDATSSPCDDTSEPSGG
jgi:hypothetical protein